VICHEKKRVKLHANLLQDFSGRPAIRCSWGTTRPASDGSVAWQRALDYFFKLNAENYLGHNDLHLPNFKEPCCLVNNSKSNTAAWLNNLGFINVQAGAY
jgi:hypothetical protein